MFHISGELSNVVEGTDWGARLPGFESWIYHLLG